MRLPLPKSLVGRTALFVTLILMANQMLWFAFVRPMVFNRYVQGDQVVHPAGVMRIYLDIAWGAFALLSSSLGVYVIFYWLRRQLRDLVRASRLLGAGGTPDPLPETGPQEVRELSHGFNQLAKNLEALEADRRLMLVGISHDLSTPLTRLRLALELLQLKGQVPQAEGMLQDLEDMNAILRQFTDYARTGREEAPASGDLNQLITEVCARYRAGGRSIREELEPVPPFRFRPLAIRRLVTNLLDNAARYGVEDVRIHTHGRDGQVVLRVLDRGPGIRLPDPNELIKPFARENAARGTQPGAGLGLSIVDRIAKAHGGAVRLANREGGGISATVTLPIPHA